jgi:LysW-gamma-L-lysine carboxypeptidase
VTRPLYVVKVGSSTIDDGRIFDEVAELARRARVLLVAGGATGISRHYRSIGREVPMLRLRNGDTVRHCSPEEMEHVRRAYHQRILPVVAAALRERGLVAWTTTADHASLVTGRPNRPLRAVVAGRELVVRDHRVGVPTAVATERVSALLATHDVVCLSPPLADEHGAPLNVDADVLAAALSNSLSADHLRLVTSTSGLLRSVDDPGSTLLDTSPDEAVGFASGRMRQKVRAAELASRGSADVAIAGPHTMADSARWTRIWPRQAPTEDLTLLTRAVQIPSVSGDESELARFLVDWCTRRGLPAEIDAAGNFVATKGTGSRRLLMMGHLDTVPFHWPAAWQDGELSGRGSVDAKGSLCAFVETLADLDLPDDVEVRVVGAVEEEVSSSRGAFHARDHYPADAVVIGEPSGSAALTLGYFGLLKVRVSAVTGTGHSAGKEVTTAPDALVAALDRIRDGVGKAAPDALSAVVDLVHDTGAHSSRATGVLNFRVPPGADPEELRDAALAHDSEAVTVTVLRCTPGYAGGRASTLARAFARSFTRAGIRPRYLVKKGTSDMNTLATTWQTAEMVAYGPGDASLDHTDVERIPAQDYQLARRILADALQNWLTMGA